MNTNQLEARRPRIETKKNAASEFIGVSMDDSMLRCGVDIAKAACDPAVFIERRGPSRTINDIDGICARLYTECAGQPDRQACSQRWWIACCDFVPLLTDRIENTSPCSTQQRFSATDARLTTGFVPQEYSDEPTGVFAGAKFDQRVDCPARATTCPKATALTVHDGQAHRRDLEQRASLHGRCGVNRVCNTRLGVQVPTLACSYSPHFYASRDR